MAVATWKNTQKTSSQLPIAKKTGFSETFLFSKITFWKKKTLTSRVNYSTLLSSTEITFQNKEKYSTQYNYSILQLEYFFLLKLYNDSDLHAQCHLLELLVDACCS